MCFHDSEKAFEIIQRELSGLTVMTDSVVLRSKDLALLRGGRVEGKPGPCPSSRFCSCKKKHTRKIIRFGVLLSST